VKIKNPTYREKGGERMKAGMLLVGLAGALVLCQAAGWSAFQVTA
jgi:hypothetical protein